MVKTICVYCGKEYNYTHHNDGTLKKYCCVRCKEKHKEELLLIKNEEFFKPRICKHCGREYILTQKGNWNKDNVQVIEKQGKSSSNFVVNSEVYCCYECGKADRYKKVKDTMIERYDVENAMYSVEIKEKFINTLSNKTDVEKLQTNELRKQTCLNKYGVNSTLKLEGVSEKAKNTLKENKEEINKKKEETCLAKYGTTSTNKLDSMKEKSKDTCLKKYGKENYAQTDEYHDKFKQTCLEKYGVEHPSQAKEIQDKKIETNLRKYNKLYSFNYDKVRETNLERYGVEYATQNKEIRNKVLITNLERHNNIYGFDYDKAKQTNLERYGTEYYSQSQVFRDNLDEFNRKQYETKKKNNSFTKSSFEIEIKELLLVKFPDMIYQYRSEKYPFNCDFYLPSFDLYIEYQGSWTHGKKPFENTVEDQKILLKWQEKALKSNFYKQAIETWTIRDILKRKTAKENNLNWIEFFNMDQFMSWYNKI